MGGRALLCSTTALALVALTTLVRCGESLAVPEDETPANDAASDAIVDAATGDAPTARPAPEELAGGEVQPSGLVVSADTLFWTLHDGTIRTCTIASCAATKKDVAVPATRADGGYARASDFTTSIVVDESYIYWHSLYEGVIFRCPRAGCAVAGPELWYAGTGSTSNPVRLFGDQANIYWTDWSAPPLRRCAKADPTCVPQQVSDSAPFPNALATGGASAVDLFWLAGNKAGETNGELSRVKKDAANAERSVIQFGVRSPTSLAVTESNVFYTSGDDGSPDAGAGTGSVWKGLANGGQAEATMLVGGLGRPQAIALDDARVYWVEVRAGRIAACPRSGCGAEGPIVLASGQDEPFDLALDATHVYWTTRSGGTLMRVEK